MRNAILTAVFFLGLALSVQAQKIGYVNSQEILSTMPEVKAAESDLMAFRDQKQKLIQTKVEAAQAEYQALSSKQQAGELTPKQLQEGEASLQAKQEELAKMEEDVQGELIERREAKFQPIFDRVNAAIEAIAKEQGYSYVFDATASGVIVYADETMNITELVKAKMASN